MSAQYYSPWHVYDADGVERPAFLRVQLSAVSQDELNQLLEEFRRLIADAADPAIGADVIAWLAERGIQAEIMPIVPGTF